MDVETGPVTLADIEEAAERIKARVRRTPCLRARFNRTPLHAGELFLKLECLQVTGSFKARGANNAVLQLDARLADMGIHETERNINNKISRGGFGAVFLVLCLVAAGCKTLTLL